MTDHHVFEPEEIVLAGKVLAILEEARSADRSREESAAHLREVMDQLVRLQQVVTGYPSVIKPSFMAGRKRDVHTLTDKICCSNPYTIEAYIPTRAVVGRAYLVAKFNFLRMLVRSVQHHVLDEKVQATLLEDLQRLVREMVTTMIAEDVLISIASDPQLELELRRKSTYVLAELWEHRTTSSVRDLFPLLNSIWCAKARTTISYGTLCGTTEILSLVRAGCDPAVLDYFGSESVPDEERESWLELIFNATFEELQTLRRYMEAHRKDVIDAQDVAEAFHVPISRLHQTVRTPEDMFFTFRERQVNAYHRHIHKLPGPTKTAEEYLMVFYLKQIEARAPTAECQA